MATCQEPVFPLELWALIIQRCPTYLLKPLALVSKSLCDEARRSLYRDIRFAEHYGFDPWVATGVKRLASLRHTLSHSTFWHGMVRSAHFYWSNNMDKDRRGGLPLRPANEDEEQRDNLIVDIANLLSKSPVFEFLHLQPPHSSSTVPLKVPVVHVLKTPVLTTNIHDCPDFAQLQRLFQISTLRYLELDAMSRLDCDVPVQLRQTGFSNLTHLSLTRCGPVGEQLRDLLAWPSRLLKLEVSSDMPELYNRYPMDGYFSSENVVFALQPQKAYLQEFMIEAQEIGGCDYEQLIEGHAFKDFAMLRRLHIPLSFLMEFSEWNEDLILPEGWEDIPPIHTRLPPSLEELDLIIGSDLAWYRYLLPSDEQLNSDDPIWDDAIPGDGEGGLLLPSRCAQDIFKLLSGIPPYREECFPQLQRVTIRKFGNDGFINPEQHPLDYPLKWNSTIRLLEAFSNVGIEMIFE
ncbi:hypothetical protein K490DRAFT_64291 [Saccharata proteae CBS 121410]|uniref:F-box domain-containing protein n=1 Tax=Saccharata proteae CBS 121410 TaxID=1314787 RepID=A0A6A5YE52_9PEZI|nr:hypothetical protein K490DRAFT_64291 [Saccharata proteae CBS 121410]